MACRRPRRPDARDPQRDAHEPYGIELYASLEAETGLATGWKQCGSLNVFKTPERLQALAGARWRARRASASSSSSSRPRRPRRSRRSCAPTTCPGAVWIPGDGKANPTDLTQSLAKGARMRGARIFEGVKVTGVKLVNGHVAGVEWSSAEGAGADRLRHARQLRRPMGARARPALRRQRAAVRRRALLRRHRQDRRRHARTCR